MSKTRNILSQVLIWLVLFVPPILALAAMLAWAFSSGVPSPASIGRLDGRARFDMLMALASDLRTGMEKHEVEKLLGRPDNQDNEHVWFWCCDSKSREVYQTWRQLYQFGDGPRAFVLFDGHGRLLTHWLHKVAEGSPWYTYYEYYSMGPGRGMDDPLGYTESVLGPDPDELIRGTREHAKDIRSEEFGDDNK